MPRQARLDAPGTLHHVIIMGIEKKQIVEDAENKREFVSRMGDLPTQESHFNDTLSFRSSFHN